MRRIAIYCFCAPLLLGSAVFAADHNDPNSINSIFSDINVSAADLYDLFGWPSSDGENVILALTFASVPRAGIFDTDMLYRINIVPNPRVQLSGEGTSLDDLLHYAAAVKEKYLHLQGSEVRVKVEAQQAHVDFIDFPSGTFSRTVPMNKPVTVEAPDKTPIQVYIGGRDDAFFNDLPGFFRSINYTPQYYKIPLSDVGDREMKIPKTLLELEGNMLFNYDPNTPKWGRPGGFKKDLPPGPYAWTGNRFAKDANGNYRFVYGGTDAQTGGNVNAIIVEIPLRFVTTNPERNRIVEAWGESWVLKASSKIETIPDEPRVSVFGRFGSWVRGVFKSEPNPYAAELQKYKKVDADGVPFLDAALNLREDSHQEANNIPFAREYVVRFAHLGWGFGPSVSALGLGTCFDHDNSPVSVYRTYSLATNAFPRVAKCFFQTLNMPDDSWNPKHLNIPLRRTFEVFIPNVNAIDMDTTGTWPFGRRPEDQVATRFLSTFLDMKTGCGGKPCNVETLADQALWDAAPITPKTPPNPLHNDKPFLDRFPYLADPW